MDCCAVALSAALLLAGCASNADPALLTQAGFARTNLAGNQTLAALPSGTLSRATVDGRTVYAYPDPQGCGCAYVGSAGAADAYRTLQQNSAAAYEERLRAIDAAASFKGTRAQQ